MATDRTEIVVLLDRSGSMEKCRTDHEGGLRSFVRDQRNLAGDVRFSFIRFDGHDPFEKIYEGVPLADIEDDMLEVIPRGSTPLWAALQRTLKYIKKRLASLPEKPDQVVLLIITDGQNNDSDRFGVKAETVRELLEQFEQNGGKALYLGANVDEFTEGGMIGIPMQNVMGYRESGAGISAMYTTLSTNVASARSMIQGGEVGLAAIYENYNFTPEQRTSAKTPDKPSTTDTTAKS